MRLLSKSLHNIAQAFFCIRSSTLKQVLYSFWNFVESVLNKSFAAQLKRFFLMKEISRDSLSACLSDLLTRMGPPEESYKVTKYDHNVSRIMAIVLGTRCRKRKHSGILLTIRVGQLLAGSPKRNLGSETWYIASKSYKFNFKYRLNKEPLCAYQAIGVIWKPTISPRWHVALLA